jgi:hypothetical protein
MGLWCAMPWLCWPEDEPECICSCCGIPEPADETTVSRLPPPARELAKIWARL